MLHSVTSFDLYPESSSSRGSFSVSLHPVTSSFLDLSSSLKHTTPRAKFAWSSNKHSSCEKRRGLTLNDTRRTAVKSQVYTTEDGVTSTCLGCNYDGLSAATTSTSSLDSVPEASLSISSESSQSSGNHVIGPVYDDLPKITPAYLRYLRAETKRSEEHMFGSVASRGTDISREERWEARMSELRRREEADSIAREGGNESKDLCQRKGWFRMLVPQQSHK